MGELSADRMKVDQGSVENLRIAGGADKSVRTPHVVLALQHRFDPLVEARLANVVHRLRSSWIAGPAEMWADVHSIRELPLSQFEKRVATTLASGFFQFSQFLAGFEMLALQLQESGIVSEQSLLGLEQLLQQGGGFFVDECCVPDRAQPLGDIPCGGD